MRSTPHPYRTHNCNQLNIQHVSEEVKLSGWIYRRRDHGNLLFIDLRDHFGIVQLLFTDQNQELLDIVSRLRLESVITIVGKVQERSSETINTGLDTGQVEVLVTQVHIESEAQQLPFPVNAEQQDLPEDLRLKYRFLDLRRLELKKNIMLRGQIIAKIRDLMHRSGFLEFQTPILTASSPEGARDFLVPSRLHPGQFYALPQAPQQFKQLLMVAGFDKYFQIAPCFRDEDARADRSPGEFYQLDVEMSFVTQEDVFAAIEPVMHELFTTFANGKTVSPYPFQRIEYTNAILKYGSDKPDLRNPIEIADDTSVFKDSNFTIFANAIAKGCVVRGIPAPGCASHPRSFFDKMIEFAVQEGASGLAYIQFDEQGGKGPIAKFLSREALESLMSQHKLKNGDAIFFSCDLAEKCAKIAGKVRDKLGRDLNLIDANVFHFCWITDFPFYELDDTGKISFSHNPFSMPQGGLRVLKDAKNIEDLLKINAFQYDIVCNGIELSSGAIRNHKPEIMYKAFEIAGYSTQEVEERFAGMLKAFKFGAPPHGGIAPGIDRIVMLLAGASNIREVITFPFNQQAQDLLMNAPSTVTEKQLRELGIKLR
ncbi:Aspartate--tRNA ligase [Rickettsiales endosymbiont of Paramecium tredecaurelia]|uniref:aspartate--tRNA ligase n=1 Tax=Candidatus Sarmatiella mevalonica TaxID=2770581 RepID=UPI001922FA9A|nr:aspartate--tRNA ligase [Candidatus Sarmatiella mevalonica]MBL3284985.1 Aspartate--tRNA ligase [Candidatus Sarmatiella mevalonica]